MISFITPTFNSEKNIFQTLKSVQTSTTYEYEHIIIDNCSSDKTLEIVQNFPHTQICSERDQGTYDAMNKGIAMAKGDYIFIINSGDTYIENSINKIIEIFQKNKNVMIVAASCFLTINSVNIKFNRKLYPLDKMNPSIKHPAIFCKKNLYKIIGDFDLNYNISSDYDFIIRAIDKKIPIINSEILTTNIEEFNNSGKLKNYYKKKVEHIKIFFYSKDNPFRKFNFFLKVLITILLDHLSMIKKYFYA